MRIALFLVLFCLCQLSAESSKRFWRKRVKKLENKISQLEKRLGKLENAFCSRPDCPKGFVQYSNTCLKFVVGEAVKKTWQEAREDCQQLEADLVTIDLRRKEKFIAKHLFKKIPDGKDFEMFTGLVATTDTSARVPYHAQSKLLPNPPEETAISMRWAATDHALTKETFFKHPTSPPFAKWSPSTIHGTPIGPLDSLYVYDNTCVSVRLSPNALGDNSKMELMWTYVSGRRSRNYICERKIKKPLCG